MPDTVQNALSYYSVLSALLYYTVQGALLYYTVQNAARVRIKLQALVYDILPSTTAVFSYAVGSRKMSANEQFFVGAQTVVSWLQTTQIKRGVPFIASNKIYTSTNKTTIV